MVDCHTHSYFSSDSKMDLEAGIKKAQDAGLKGITFTDHYEFDYPNPNYPFTFDVVNRAHILTMLQKEVGSSFRILQGIEIGIRPHALEKIHDIIDRGSFDFILASIHVVNNVDASDPAYYENKTKAQAFLQYLEEILYLVTHVKDFDVVSHIGYVRRYAPYKDTSLTHQEFGGIIDRILTKVIERNKGIEVNVSGLRQGLGSPIPDFDILKRYKELGGNIITLGSDAHTADDVGKNFTEVKNKLKDIGFSHAAYFYKRKPVFYEL